MKTDKSGIVSIIVVLLVVCGLQIVAQTVPPLGPSPFADTEISTNVAVTAWTQNTRNISVVLSLGATPSNNVQVAIGTDADADGRLADEETGLTLGWDCGEWFLSTDATTNVYKSSPIAGVGLRRELTFTVRLHPDGRPRAMEALEDGASLAFSELDDSTPPKWLFTKSWDLLKVTARGVDLDNECVSVRFGTDPMILLLR